MGDKTRRRGHRALALLEVATVVLGACTAGAAPSGSTSTSGPTPPSASPVATPSGAVGICTAASLDVALDELMAAIGNPDTNAPSEASQALDDALAAGDPAQIEATAAVVLDHLAKGHTLIAAGPTGTDERLAVACIEWEEMIRDIEEGTARLRDGGMAGATDQVEAGRALVVGALQDHFWQAAKGADPTMFIEYTRDGRMASASRARLSMGASQAFDGNLETAWTTGDALPPQWIQIDLGWPATIAGVRLLTFQDVDGASEHTVTIGRAEGADREMTVFAGETRDKEVLEYTAPSPVADIQVVRVTTDIATGTIGWREIEVVLAPGSSPSPCPASDTPLAGLTVSGGPPQTNTTPDMAIDGDPATAWDPGPSGSIWINFAEPAQVSELRVLIGDVPADAPGWMAQVFNGSRWLQLGPVVPGDAVDGWLMLAGPAPCVAISGFQLVPWMGIEANPPIREIEVLGVPAAP